MNLNTILITGGIGYIGSHTCVLLLEYGYNIIILDNLFNSDIHTIDQIKTINQKDFIFIQGDVRDQELLSKIFANYQIAAVIHFAGLKAVSESMSNPLIYFDNNIHGSISLLNVMKKSGVYHLIFSSSATVYDANNISPLTENMLTTSPNNNYGYTKLVVEQILEKFSISDPEWSIAILRYFNPIGAHPSGLIGENPKDTPNNLLPYLTQVAAGQRNKLFVFGNDYPTPDGTGVRDYIHVLDLANAHIKALENRFNHNGYRIWNIGTGQGYSVLDIIQTFEKVNNVKICYEITNRREGDVAISYADNSRAKEELNWSPKFTFEQMLIDSWKWQRFQEKLPRS